MNITTNQLRKIDILVVEDSPTQAEQLKYLLEKRLYSVVIAMNGSHALKVLETISPKIIITDICMPEMDGYEFCRRVKANDSQTEIPVILLTSLSNPEDVIEGLECGADNFITKPYSEEYILSHIEQILATSKLKNSQRVRVGVEIMFAGKRRFITADQQQMLSLLISTYEAAVIRNKELLHIQEELQTINENLEELVEERTAALRINEQKYQDLYDHAPSMFLSVEYLTGKVIECNETLLKRTGFKRSEIIGSNIFSIYHPDSLETAKRNFNHFNETGEITNSEIDLNTVLGGKIPVLINATAVRDNDGKILHSRTVLQDISELKQIQEELIQSEEQFRAVADSAVDSIITIDCEGIIVGWNQGATKTFGFNETEMIGQPIKMLIPDNYLDLHQAGLKRVEQGAETHVIGKTVELSGQRKNGEVFPIELSMARWHTSKDHFYTGIIRDITQRKLVEIELIKAKEKAVESDQLKSAFLLNMSHEIRTPMNAILGFSEMLNDPDLSSEDKESFIATIHQSTNQLLHIITDIVDISKIETNQEKIQSEVFNLQKFLNDMITSYEPQARKKNLKLQLQNLLPVHLVIIISDSNKLRQIFNNIIENALKFTEKGTIEIKAAASSNKLIFSISDTGIGIDSSLHQIIFDRFRQGECSLTRRYGGLGLGLSLTKSYTEMLGGNIQVESIPGIGSTFIVEIPLITEIEQPAEMADVKKVTPNTWKDKTILVAEDETANTLFIKTILGNTGIQIISVENGLEAVEICKTNHDISLVLMDIKMPEMDGLTATRIIKSFRKDLPIIATTAFALSSDREKCLEVGCDNYLSKPIKKDNLISTMNEYLAK